MANVKSIIAAVYELKNTDPTNPATVGAVDNLLERVAHEELRDVSVGFLKDQVQRLQVAAATPARNYTRILSIASALDRAVQVASKSEDQAMKAKIASIIQKVAGIFR
jgi:hypothetical protein